MKKRIISLLCAVLMLTAVCVPAFAATNNDNDNTFSPASLTPYGYSFYLDGKTVYIPDGIVLGPEGWGISSGIHVTTAQKVLNSIHNRFAKYNDDLNCYVGAADGIYGQKTFSGAMSFQAWSNRMNSKKIQADGLIGPATLGMMSYYNHDM